MTDFGLPQRTIDELIPILNQNRLSKKFVFLVLEQKEITPTVQILIWQSGRIYLKNSKEFGVNLTICQHSTNLM